MVDKLIRDKIWELYVPGQEDTKSPTKEYLYWFYRAILCVAAKEGKLEHRHCTYAFCYVERWADTYEPGFAPKKPKSLNWPKFNKG